jgi:hypothetical protein
MCSGSAAPVTGLSTGRLRIPAGIVLHESRRNHDVAGMQRRIDGAGGAGQEKRRRLEVPDQQRGDDRGIDLPGSRAADHDLSTMHPADPEHISPDGHLAAVLQTSLDRRRLLADPQHRHNGLCQCRIREDVNEKDQARGPEQESRVHSVTPRLQQLASGFQSEGRILGRKVPDLPPDRLRQGYGESRRSASREGGRRNSRNRHLKAQAGSYAWMNSQALQAEGSWSAAAPAPKGGTMCGD